MQDRDLLREYVLNRSEAAFAELVARHINMVFAAARRVVSDEHLAKDITQNTFIHLARNASSVRNGDALGGWLYRVTCNMATSAVRSEHRRREREHTAMSLAELHQPDAAAWSAISPMLEEAMRRLSADEQDAVVLRYFEGKSLREVGLALNLSDDAAQKRVSRALEKIRAHFARRGITTSVVVLVGLLGAHSVHAAPVGLATGVAGGALAGSAVGAGAAGSLVGRWLAKKAVVGLTVLMAGGAAAVIWHYSGARPIASGALTQASDPPGPAATREGAANDPETMTLEAPLNPGLDGTPSQFVISSMRTFNGKSAIVCGEGSVSPVPDSANPDAGPARFVLEYRISWQVFDATPAKDSSASVSSNDDFEIHSTITLQPNTPVSLMRVNGKSATLQTDGQKIILTITRTGGL